MESNERFFKKVSNNIGVEGFEEFKDTDTMDILNKLDKANVDLELLAEVNSHLVKNLDKLKEESMLGNDNMMLVVENFILRFAIQRMSPTVFEELDKIIYIVSDAAIQMIKGEE
jgi:hypothetical protein